MSNIDQEFVEFVVKSIVGKPEAVEIERKIDEKGVLLTLSVDQEDLGRVIGKRGATAQSIRTLLRALGTKNEARYNLKIADNGSPAPARRDDSAAASDDNNTPALADEPAEEEVVEQEPAEESAVDKAKRELADLDDLDI